MKLLNFTIFILFLVGSVSAQSKKEQIASLTYKVDSLNAVIKSVTNAAQSKEKTLNFTVDSITIKLNSTKNELIRISNNFDEKNEENSSLNALKNQLEIELISLKEEIAKLKTDSIRDNRFEKLDEVRTINFNGKPLVLYPFEMFDIMTFEGATSGCLNPTIDFLVTDTGQKFSFDDNNNKIEWDELDFTEDLKTGDLVMKGMVAHILLKCDCDEENIRRSLVKNREYKVIYSFKSDSELWRKPFPTESTDGYYIVDVLELNEQFEREKEKW